jgi:hypothetical protein
MRHFKKILRFMLSVSSVTTATSGSSLSNASDKPVLGVMVSFDQVAPSGCALEPQRDDMDSLRVGGGGFELRIVPHGNAVASRVGIFRPDEMPPQATSYPRLTGVTPQGAVDPHYAKGAVLGAQEAKAGYLQVQFGVTGVFFEDGSTWPAQWPTLGLGNSSDPFDRKPVEAEAGKCADVATVANALQSVERVVFEKETPDISDKSNDDSVPPHLRFSCSLEGLKATCRLPLETNHHTSSAQPEKVK